MATLLGIPGTIGEILMYTVLNITQALFMFKSPNIHNASALVDLEASKNDEVIIGDMSEYEDWTSVDNKKLVNIYKALNDGQPPVNVTRRQLVQLIIEKINARPPRVVNEIQLDCQCDVADKERKTTKEDLRFIFKPNSYTPERLQ